MRRSRATQSSLDLLLDTIANTFGGVVFLAILVAILLQLSGSAFESSPSTDIDPAELERMRQELVHAVGDLESLERAAAAQRELLDSLGRSDLQKWLEKIVALRTQRDGMLADRLDQLKDLRNGLAKIGEIQQDLRSLDTQLAEASTEIARGNAALESEVKARTTTARLPTVRPTLKGEVALVMRYGRLYQVHKRAEQILQRELNTDDFVILQDDDDQVRVTPKPYAGILIDGDNQFRGRLRNIVTLLDNNATYLAIAIWEDSFNGFALLKSALVEEGFEYRLLPMKEGMVVSETEVENPLVQ